MASRLRFAADVAIGLGVLGGLLAGALGHSWGLTLVAASGAIMVAVWAGTWLARRGTPPAAAWVVGAVLLVVLLLVSGILTHPGSVSTSTEISRVPVTPVALKSYPSRGHLTDHMCLVERNHHKFSGSCQDFYSTRVSGLHRACHACGGKEELPCHPWRPGMVCTALLHYDFHSWGPPLYSLHQTVRAYFDGYHIWAGRSYKGWKGWQRCWVGYAVGADVDITKCGVIAQYRQNGSYRVQGNDWYFDVRVGLDFPWIPVQSGFRDNMRHWPYPGPSEGWVS